MGETDPSRRKGRGRAVLALGLAIAALLGVRYALRGELEPEQVVGLLKGIQARGWAVPAYLGLFLLLTTLFAPAALLFLAAGATWGFGLGVVLNIVALNLSAWIQFLAARRLGRERLRWLLERKGAAGLDRLLARSGTVTVMLIRLLPLPTMAVSLAGGLSSIRLRDFAAGTAIGTLPIIVIYTWFAAALVENVEAARGQVLGSLVIAGAGLVVLALAPRAWARWRKRRGQEVLP